MMAMRQLILRAEARHDYVRPKIPDDPDHVCKNLVVIPETQRFFSCFGKPEIGRSCEELFGVIDASRVEQFLCPNHTEALAQFWPQQILTAVPTRDRNISRVIKRAVGPERHEICVLIIGVRRDVENTTKHVELLQCEL